MKIVYLHQYFNTPDMSGGTRSFEMARRLVEAGHQVNLITTRRDPSCAGFGWVVTEEAGIKVHWCSVPYTNNMGFLKRILAFVHFAVVAASKSKKFDSDIVFATSTPLTIVLPGLFCAWWKRVPLVFEVRDMWPAVPIAMGFIKNPLFRKGAYLLERLAYRHSSHIVALAPGMRDDIVATGIASDKVTVIPNGCDNDIFGVELGTRGAVLRQHHLWLKQNKLILFAGTLGLANNVGYLVEIAAAMHEIDSNLRFLVIGDGAERKKIEDAAKTAGLLNSNFFMLPAMPKTELAAWISTCNFTVALFSGPKVLWKDAVQNKFFDSLSAGKPIACNFSGFQSELAVEHGVGIIIDQNNPAKAARQIYVSLNDYKWLQIAEHRARELAQNYFNRDKLALQLEQVLLSAIEIFNRGHNTEK